MFLFQSAWQWKYVNDVKIYLFKLTDLEIKSLRLGNISEDFTIYNVD